MTCHCDARGAGRPIGDLTNVGEDEAKLAAVGEDTATGAAVGGAIGGAIGNGPGAVVGGDIGGWAGAVYGVADNFGGDIKNAVGAIGGLLGGGGNDGPPPSTFSGQEGAPTLPPSPGMCWGTDASGAVLKPYIEFRIQPGFQCGPGGVGQVPIPTAPKKFTIQDALAVMRTAHVAKFVTPPSPSTQKILASGSLAVHLPTAVATAAPTLAHAGAIAVKSSAPSAPISTAKKVAIGGGILGTLATVALLGLRLLK